MKLSTIDEYCVYLVFEALMLYFHHTDTYVVHTPGRSGKPSTTSRTKGKRASGDHELGVGGIGTRERVVMRMRVVVLEVME